ncbi:MAG: fumarylacetoacetate hydrolase family protein [Zoogloeaceae bacterium]|jgi:fumarylpyruvate hydrolase|nr:fumarylacetoacetate hydrolase family protein [Zoogloeaceae bacterium]
MTMAQILFPPKVVPLAPIVGSDLLFPIRRIFCVGRNYKAHAAEMGISVDKTQESPMYFMKDASAYVPSGSRIPYPPMTRNLHHEIELVLAIGKAGFELREQDAWESLYGYAVGLDMTRRDLQQYARRNGQPWDTGKNYEQSAVLSSILPQAQCGRIEAARIALSVNGTLRQSANTRDFIWSIPEILADLSRYYHLEPGDLVYTGTPEGVGPVAAGDTLEGSIEGIGTIRLEVTSSP